LTSSEFLHESSEPLRGKRQVSGDEAFMDRARVNSLMELAASGDGRAYAALASTVQNELYRLAIAQGLDRQSAEDATQETLMRAYARRST
jgi:hypothetical protein